MLCASATNQKRFQRAAAIQRIFLWCLLFLVFSTNKRGILVTYLSESNPGMLLTKLLEELLRWIKHRLVSKRERDSCALLNDSGVWTTNCKTQLSANLSKNRSTSHQTSITKIIRSTFDFFVPGMGSLLPNDPSVRRFVKWRDGPTETILSIKKPFKFFPNCFFRLFFFSRISFHSIPSLLLLLLEVFVSTVLYS